MDLCVSPNGEDHEVDVGSLAQFIDGGNLNSTDEASLTVSASVHFISSLKNVPRGMFAAHGKIEVGDWAVLKDVSQPLRSLKITFVIPPDLTESGDRNCCVILTVPSSFLPLSTRSSVCVPSFLNRTTTRVGSLSAINPNDTDTACKIGTSLKLTYNRKSEQDFYLSKLEKWNVYLRLIHISYSLFAVALGLICFSLLRTKASTSVLSIDKVPLEI